MERAGASDMGADLGEGRAGLNPQAGGWRR
jgi:hypothetical protein